MTMSLAVILLEISNDVDFLLPIMLAVGVAKQVGDLFNKSLYDIHIDLQGVPMLHSTFHAISPEEQGVLNAKSIMSKERLVTVSVAVTPERLRHILTTTNHHGFPVVSSSGPNGAQHAPGRRLFAGLISRAKLVKLLEHGAEALSAAPSPSAARRSARAVGDADAARRQPPRDEPAAPRRADPEGTPTAGRPRGAPTNSGSSGPGRRRCGCMRKSRTALTSASCAARAGSGVR